MAPQSLPQTLLSFPESPHQFEIKDVTRDLVGTPLWTTKDIAPSPLSIDAGTPNTQVVLAVIASNTALAVGLYVTGVIPACIICAAVAAITNFDFLYATMEVTDSPVRHDIAGMTATILK